MLEHLHIKNVALITESEIDFEPGLNILSGETGAGKSMVIDSLNFALGERIGGNFVRKGEKSAVVEALFTVRDDTILKKLEQNGIKLEEDGTVLLTRTMNQSGKTICRINGSTVTVSMMRECAEGLMDIHGQHSHQSLLNTARHIQILDRFCGKKLEEEKQSFQTTYKKLKEIEKDLMQLMGDGKERVRKMDLLQFQMEEIGQAKLQIGEEEELLERRQILVNGEKIRNLTENSLLLLYHGTETESSAIDQLSRALEEVSDLAEYDNTIQNIYTTLSSVYAQMDDAVRDLKHYADTISQEPEELESVEERLQLIYGLKRKYGGSIEEILDFYQKAEKELDFLSNSEEIVQKLNKQKKNIEQELMKQAEILSNIRKEKAKQIQKNIEQQLWDLEMKHGKFAIAIEDKKEISLHGKDKVEFLISANAGEELKPLAKIASGGEMSRVMLALKTVLAEADSIEVFIFDEIDTGVSGRTAQKVAEKMALIGKSHQIICITHLPQIAAMADHHFLIEKTTQQEKTITTVKPLNEEESAHEIARLIGGAKMTQATWTAAKELKEQADAWKKIN
ncbi:MAG TPA: DNA repair protein RecN [Candidatus Coprocola pullicola]|nr:DNA repair protein RecN [Candidatus Coprocola pullicola]